MSERVDHLGSILVRKAREVERRKRRASRFREAARNSTPRPFSADALLRGPDGAPRVIAEIKLRSPSAGQIRARKVGEVARIALGYEQSGAAAVSVLCDGPGFGGTPLDVRRVVSAVSVPVLFKEFVLDEVQLDVARAVGASLVLLLVRALDDTQLARLIRAARERRLEPVVEAADADELERALASNAEIIGVNARDLRSFEVDPQAAQALLSRIPDDRVAIFMSGVRSAADLACVARSRADAVLIGEGLMRAQAPGAQLAEWRRALPTS